MRFGKLLKIKFIGPEDSLGFLLKLKLFLNNHTKLNNVFAFDLFYSHFLFLFERSHKVQCSSVFKSSDRWMTPNTGNLHWLCLY